MSAALKQLLDELAQDLRHSFRSLRKSPGFAAAVILTLGLGIGANAAMFGVVDRLMFRPFAYLRDPSTVHRVYMRWWDRGTMRTQWHTEYTRYLDLKKWTTSFSQYAGFAERMLAVGEGDASRERRVAAVNATFFGFFDAKPVLGRFFVAAEDTTPRGADVAVLGHGFWKAEFEAATCVGRSYRSAASARRSSASRPKASPASTTATRRRCTSRSRPTPPRRAAAPTLPTISRPTIGGGCRSWCGGSPA
ncbi:MAG: ABC transporter permease [Gemmatimonadota bacterium]|nr:ABC transporter permease [Gemmatimonadota bacterium]